jgi:choline dehydrogenase
VLLHRPPTLSLCITHSAIMLLLLLFSFFSLALASPTAEGTTAKKTYEYIVVGSGAGGGPLAVNLARAGHTVLLLEAGSDQTANTNASITANAVLADSDPKMAWDFFVRHSDNVTRDNQYKHTVWRKTDNQYYVGLTPPPGAVRLGVWYPRSATLGGCAMHNAAYMVLPNDEDWEDIVDITGDKSWGVDAMRKYFVKLEHNNYLANGSTPTHGFKGWLETSQSDATWANSPSDAKTIAEMAVAKSGGQPSKLSQYLTRDMNAADPNRDQSIGVFGGVTHEKNGMRSSPGYYIRSVLADAKKYPLTLQLNTLATKILFDKSGNCPKAIGIEYLQGESVYGADPRHTSATKGTVGQVFASREVIVSGGVFNSPQLLKLSGIGPAAELKKFKIPLVKDLPGVGANMDDNYEGAILGTFEKPVYAGFLTLFALWKTSTAKVRDIFYYCAPFGFTGFWPGYPDFYPNNFDCPFVLVNPKNVKGRVE